MSNKWVCLTHNYAIVKDESGLYHLSDNGKWLLTRVSPDNILSELHRRHLIDFVDAENLKYEKYYAESTV